MNRLNNILTVGKVANIHYFEFDSDYATVDDKHPFRELIFVVKGELDISSEEYIGKLKDNQMLIHRGNELHSLKCAKGTSPAVIIIGFECDSDSLDVFSKRPIDLIDSEVKKLAEIVKEGRSVFCPPYDKPTYNMRLRRHQVFGAEQMLHIDLEYFLISVVRRYTAKTKLEIDDMHASHNVSGVIEYIDNNYLERVTIDELAFLFGTNRATLCKAIRDTVGCTLIEYINDKKLAKAKSLIDNTDETFTEISNKLGFATIHYFTRWFKKMTGQAPREYRHDIGKSDIADD